MACYNDNWEVEDTGSVLGDSLHPEFWFETVTAISVSTVLFTSYVLALSLCAYLFVTWKCSKKSLTSLNQGNTSQQRYLLQMIEDHHKMTGWVLVWQLFYVPFIVASYQVTSLTNAIYIMLHAYQYYMAQRFFWKPPNTKIVNTLIIGVITAEIILGFVGPLPLRYATLLGLGAVNHIVFVAFFVPTLYEQRQIFVEWKWLERAVWLQAPIYIFLFLGCSPFYQITRMLAMLFLTLSAWNSVGFFWTIRQKEIAAIDRSQVLKLSYSPQFQSVQHSPQLQALQRSPVKSVQKESSRNSLSGLEILAAWECRFCNHTNDKTNDICGVCCGERPVEDSPPWLCESCFTLNTRKLTKCAFCSTPKANKNGGTNSEYGMRGKRPMTPLDRRQSIATTATESSNWSWGMCCKKSEEDSDVEDEEEGYGSIPAGSPRSGNIQEGGVTFVMMTPWERFRLWAKTKCSRKKKRRRTKLHGYGATEEENETMNNEALRATYEGGFSQWFREACCFWQSRLKYERVWNGDEVAIVGETVAEWQDPRPLRVGHWRLTTEGDFQESKEDLMESKYQIPRTTPDEFRQSLTDSTFHSSFTRPPTFCDRCVMFWATVFTGRPWEHETQEPRTVFRVL